MDCQRKIEKTVWIDTLITDQFFVILGGRQDTAPPDTRGKKREAETGARYEVVERKRRGQGSCLGRAAFWEWVRWRIHLISAPRFFPPERIAGKAA